jgi:hypothetical protein
MRQMVFVVVVVVVVVVVFVFLFVVMDCLDVWMVSWSGVLFL